MPIQQKAQVGYSEFPPGHEEMDNAVNWDGYQYLSANAPVYLTAIEAAVVKGATADEIQAYISRLVGPDRQAFVKRCAQAAAYIKKANADNYGETPVPNRIDIMAPRVVDARTPGTYGTTAGQ